MLRVRGLKKSFRAGALPFGGGASRPIVQGVDLDVEQGEIVGLLGANGAGKTTTFRMCMGTIRPDAGSVSFLGQDVTSWPMYQRARAGMGYLAQEHSEFKDLTTEQNLLVVLERLPLSRAERRKKCDALLEEYGLTATRAQLARTLSGGQKRRLEVARLLITEPKLVLFDEPWHGVDPIKKDEIQAVIYGLRSRGIAVFITDHDVDRVLRGTERVYLMHEGKVIVQGTPQQIVDDAEARRVYLGASYTIDLSARPPAPPPAPTTEDAA
jgi:lipopolysaccharide export system ATP-binding protein